LKFTAITSYCGRWRRS